MYCTVQCSVVNRVYTVQWVLSCVQCSVVNCVHCTVGTELCGFDIFMFLELGQLPINASIMWPYAVIYGPVLYSTALYCTALHCIVLHCTVVH